MVKGLLNTQQTKGFSGKKRESVRLPEIKSQTHLGQVESQGGGRWGGGGYAFVREKTLWGVKSPADFEKNRRIAFTINQPSSKIRNIFAPELEGRRNLEVIVKRWVGRSSDRGEKKS